MDYDRNFGLVMRTLAGEITAEWQNTKKYDEACRPFLSGKDARAIERILSEGYPAELYWEELAANKEASIQQGNNTTVCSDCPKLTKALDKEERNSNSHIMVFSHWLARTSPFARVNPQMVIPGNDNTGKKM